MDYEWKICGDSNVGNKRWERNKGTCGNLETLYIKEIMNTRAAGKRVKQIRK